MVEQQKAEIRLRELQEELSDWKSLLEQRAVKRWLELAREQMENRKQAVFLNPLESLDNSLRQEFQKGEISGIYLFSRIPEIQVAALESDIEKYEEAIENATGRETRDDERESSADDEREFGDFEPPV